MLALHSLAINHGVLSASPSVDHSVGVEVSPTNDAPDLPVSQSGQSVAPVSVVLNTAPISPLSARPKEEKPGSKLSFISHQNQGTGQVMMLGDAGSPRFIHRELPIYPFIARKLGKEGKVVLKLALDAQGKLQRIDTVEENGFGSADAARSAITKSTFEPAISNSRAIPSQVLVPIRFVIQEG